MPEHLFVYGTLHPDRAPREIAAEAKKLRPVGPGTICGKLYHLGAYPGVVVPAGTRGRVAGFVFALPEDEDILPRLDAYEDFRPADPESSLFVRAQCTVTLADDRRVRCWVYVYNQPLPGGS
jgi:gamma-glutamylcyclotransferase (GGCT)/AIG2-like uncharacterized protein YtfP